MSRRFPTRFLLRIISASTSMLAARAAERDRGSQPTADPRRYPRRSLALRDKLPFRTNRQTGRWPRHRLPECRELASWALLRDEDSWCSDPIKGSKTENRWPILPRLGTAHRGWQRENHALLSFPEVVFLRPATSRPAF